METASYRERPAVEPLSPAYSAASGPGVHQKGTKQMIGRMVRQVMEARSYRIDR